MSLIVHFGILPSNGRSPFSSPVELGRRKSFTGKTKNEREEKDETTLVAPVL